MKFTNPLKDKRFRYGTLSTAMMIIAVVIFVLVTLVAEEFNRNWDLTAEQMFSLSPQSERFLEELDVDITLYYLVRTGGEDLIISQLLSEYAAASPHITVEIRDPMINPAFLHQFAGGAEGGIHEGSVIVRGPHGFRVVGPDDMETVVFNWQIFQEITDSFDHERAITQAIHALTLGEPPVVYYITGSLEPPLTEAFVEFMASENFIVREHNALIHDIPETADALIIAMPGRDWGTLKADRILDFLDNNEGRVFMALDVMHEPFPELSRVLEAYGLVLGDFIIIEGDSRRTIGGNPAWMLPLPFPHEYIMDPLQREGFVQFMWAPTGIDIAPMPRPSTSFYPLLSTTRDAYGRYVNSDAETILRVPEDEEGPFLLAVAVSDTTFVQQPPHTSRLVVVANRAILDEGVNNSIGGGNWAFIANSMNWLQDQPPGIFVPVRRPPGRTPLMLNDAQVFTMSGIAIGGIPAILLGIGIFVWFRRRHS